MTVRLTVKVVPGSTREGPVGWLGDALKIRVRARPERGRANAAVEQRLSEWLGLPRRSVRIAAGRAAAVKSVEIEGLTAAELDARLARALRDVEA